MAGNSELGAAKKNKKDEFYTQRDVIDAELRYYTPHFKDKTVFCNCDDPYESNFFKYFAMNFQALGLKKLIATCYSGSSIAGTQISLFEDEITVKAATAYKVELIGVTGVHTLDDVRSLVRRNVKKLKGDGDFRSLECIKLLKQADIVVTNPPFSLFREYVAQLVEFQKKFLIIGNINSVTYKEIFPLIAQNTVWLGVSISSGDREFRVPDDYPLTAAGCRVDENGIKYIRVKGVRWFTNLDHNKRHEELQLFRTYDSDSYPQYDNYSAVNVGKVVDIPKDYYGAMGVPITFLDKYNPDQFEIIGLGCSKDTLPDMNMLGSEFVDRYKLQGGTGHYSANMWGLALIDKGKYSIPYGRIIIKRKVAQQ